MRETITRIIPRLLRLESPANECSVFSDQHHVSPHLAGSAVLAPVVAPNWHYTRQLD